MLASCPLTVVDLGSLPPGPAPRAAAVAADDRRIAAIISPAPAGSIVMVAGMGDSASTHGGPHLRTIVIGGPGYQRGQLTSAATRQPGVVTITDLTPSIYGWLGRQAPSGLVGSPITSVARGPLPTTLPQSVDRSSNMPDNVSFSNPDTMQKPPGYSHVVEVTGPGRTALFRRPAWHRINPARWAPMLVSRWR